MEYFSIGDSYSYNLTRVKTAFAVGTVSLEDFEEFDENVIDDIVDYLLKNNVTVSNKRMNLKGENGNEQRI
jgi:hypothetical protein